MKIIQTILCFLMLLNTATTQAQSYISKDNKIYLDTITTLPNGCTRQLSGYYYGLDAKYPMASETLVSLANQYLVSKNIKVNSSGYITFRFTINCDGKPAYIELLQSTNTYLKTEHQPQLVLALYDFFKTLSSWKIVKNEQGEAVNYNSFISFKLNHEKVVTVIP